MKKSSVITLILAGVLLTNCVSCLSEKKNKKDREEKETQETTEETKVTEETIPAPTATPTPTPEPTATPTPTEKPTPTQNPAQTIPVDDISEDELYKTYRSYVEENHTGDEKYGYISIFRSGGDIWLLGVLNGNGEHTEYALINGEMTDVTDMLNHDNIDKQVTSYDQFMKLPCFVDLYTCLADEITDSADDGTFFGEITAVSEDGGYMLVSAGEAVTLTKEEYDALEVGDVVYSGINEDIYVQEIDEDGYKRLSDFSMWFAPNDFTGNEDEYILVTSSVNPMTVNDKLFVVPISPDCEIDDHTEYLFSEPTWNQMDGSYDEYISNLEDATSLRETLYWFHFMVNNESDSLGNGWRETGGLIYPIVIENGEVTMMSIQWR